MFERRNVLDNKIIVLQQYLKFAILGKIVMLGVVALGARSTRLRKHIS